ncbi:MAG TPA: hypothetical protein VFU71_13520 [Burkholderiaceae bacterium]|nr:hypothetical protein [Burkholderiaceae bacterium]
MSWFRSEARKEHGGPSTDDMVAMSEPRTERPAAGSRLEAEIAVHAKARSEELRREEHRRDELRREELQARRVAESLAAAHAQEEQKVEDAVVTREHSAEGEMPVNDNGRRIATLFTADVAQDYRGRWDAAQIGFVDDPREAVRLADELVAQMMKTLVQSFTSERKQLEAQLSDTASTENLRVAMQRYRSYFQRLITL